MADDNLNFNLIKFEMAFYIIESRMTLIDTIRIVYTDDCLPRFCCSGDSEDFFTVNQVKCMPTATMPPPPFLFGLACIACHKGFCEYIRMHL